MDTTATTPGTPTTWRLRVRLDDRPGALARVTTRLAARDCNVLSLSVLPVPGGVVDEIVVHTPPGVQPAQLIDEIRAEGGRCVGITRADLRHLVDRTTAALRAAGAALRDPSATAESVRSLLGADSVTVADPGAGSAPDEGGHRAVLTLGDGTALVARRGWAPFTEVELARVAAFGEVLTAGEVAAATPSAVITGDGAGIVLRGGTPADADAVADLHARCSAQTLFARYHAGLRTLPRRWLHRLLQPPRGTTLLALCGTEVIGMAQLIRTNDPAEAEISVLVEDSWQRRGVGQAMISRLGAIARGAGHQRMIAWCLPSEVGFERAATSSGLPVAVRREDNMLRVALTVGARQQAAAPVSAS
ncbi:GNAT family N-acetyltransferase [Actinokineospora iranica]|uniref:Acetyltransferase (GNAT) family protein n=1 Tax=Actinokineospora iranica TaxID=1271860 RepID=A0A1G6KAK2_9PSEU|nr:GNAT family N-acetyltransferase [Actinokineospora iranica]SDC27851.1 Acetyltransferase (GNAT) family protein [Actinokineospora iranica]